MNLKKLNPDSRERLSVWVWVQVKQAGRRQWSVAEQLGISGPSVWRLCTEAVARVGEPRLHEIGLAYSMGEYPCNWGHEWYDRQHERGLERAAASG